MGGKDKVNPKNLQDSFETESLVADLTSDSEISEMEPSTSRQTKPKNRFKEKQSAKPKSSNEELLNFLKQEAEEMREDRRKQFSLMERRTIKFSETGSRRNA
ncbi:hypothetical protein QE152_g40112 [Popillia japonica]|uniref:Uncharacterized protein n=1 Tax=Popillia japonica TaxID=7064 RepID=A0AAW1HSE9_POPJA